MAKTPMSQLRSLLDEEGIAYEIIGVRRDSMTSLTLLAPSGSAVVLTGNENGRIGIEIEQRERFDSDSWPERVRLTQDVPLKNYERALSKDAEYEVVYATAHTFCIAWRDDEGLSVLTEINREWAEPVDA